MTDEKLRNLIRMMEVGIQRLKEAENDIQIAQVLRTMGAICTNQYGQIQREFERRVDDNLAHQHLINCIKETA